MVAQWNDKEAPQMQIMKAAASIWKQMHNKEWSDKHINATGRFLNAMYDEEKD